MAMPLQWTPLLLPLLFHINHFQACWPPLPGSHGSIPSLLCSGIWQAASTRQLMPRMKGVDRQMHHSLLHAWFLGDGQDCHTGLQYLRTRCRTESWLLVLVTCWVTAHSRTTFFLCLLSTHSRCCFLGQAAKNIFSLIFVTEVAVV